MKRYIAHTEDRCVHFVRDTLTGTECWGTRYTRRDSAEQDANRLSRLYNEWTAATARFYSEIIPA